jgi:hypothetical protein
VEPIINIAISLEEVLSEGTSKFMRIKSELIVPK